MAQLLGMYCGKTSEVMTTKSKLIFADELNYSDKSKFIDYAEVKIKSGDRLNGGMIKMILAYIYFFTLASGIIFLLSK